MHTTTVHDERWLRWLETQDYLNDERIYPLWLAVKGLLFNDREAMHTLFERFTRFTVQERMARISVRTILMNSREGVTLDTVLEPFVTEMITWYRATTESERPVHVPLLLS